MRTNYVLIDYENVQPEIMAELDKEHFKVIVFVGASQAKVTFEVASVLQRMGSRAEYIKISNNGSNALDFHIAFYIGQISVKEPDAFFHIVSKDTGFDPLIAHLKGRKIFSSRSKEVSEIPIIKAAANSPVVIPVSTPVTQLASKPAAFIAPTPVTKKTSDVKIIEDRVKLIVEDLKRRGTSRPRVVKTLSNTIRSIFQKKLSELEVEELINALLSRGIIIIINSTKVAYHLNGK